MDQEFKPLPDPPEPAALASEDSLPAGEPADELGAAATAADPIPAFDLPAIGAGEAVSSEGLPLTPMAEAGDPAGAGSAADGGGDAPPEVDPAVAAGEAAGYRWRRLWWPGFALAGCFLIIGAVVGLAYRGPVREFMIASLEVLPFVPLPLLAYLGVRQLWARIASFLWLGALVWGMALVILVLAFASMKFAFSPGTMRRLGAVALWDLAAIGLSALVLAGTARRRLARALPIDPRSPVHAVALSLVTAAAVMLLGQLIAQHGRPPYLTLLKADPSIANSPGSGPLSMLFGLVWMLPAGLILVGWPVVRTWRGALARLGLVRPTVRQVIFAAGLGLLLVLVSSPVESAVGQLFHAAGWPRTDEKLFEQLLGPSVSRWGALAVGVSAGLGEEMIVRGALQPRLGLLLSVLFFTSLHALQYGFDALLSVFLLGTVLGIVRARANTTTSAIVHGVYDFTLLFIAALGKH